MKENVITGHLIPAGTGLREYERLVVGPKDELDRLSADEDSEMMEKTVSVNE